MFPVSDVIPPRTTPFVTMGLIAATALTFFYELQLDRSQLFELSRRLGAIPAESGRAALLTSLWLHDGWIHVAGNMLYLWLFGANVEDAMGHAAFLLFYVAVGMAGTAAHAGLNPASPLPLIGANHAVAGVIGTYFILFPKSQILVAIPAPPSWNLIEVPAVFFLGVWLVLQLASGLESLGAQVANVPMTLGAQGVGLAAGVAIGVLLRWRGTPWQGR